MGSISETPGYDRQAELKTFDESQAGVKGLIDSGITEIPSIFHIPPHLVDARPVVGPSDGFTIPIIDLAGASGEKRKQIVEEIREASAKWGCFQVVNHGAPLRVLEGMDVAVRGFFDLDLEEKKEFFGRDTTKRYCKEVLKVGDVIILELLSEALGLNPNQLKEMGCAKGIYVVSHYYPACPQPELTQGTSLHQDNDFITVLYQDHNGGLQFLHQDHWVDVPPVQGLLSSTLEICSRQLYFRFLSTLIRLC
ncbi:unnamed protein product [Linum tenue]|uniref:Uncharacterized protein n=1 Tax=Linum tenue TaxID=586396 RepID=A0AAV0RNG8_9ROSI|nr:unnamed protein product [Linum tenue]